MKILATIQYSANGVNYTFNKVKKDINGNNRYLIHKDDLGLNSNEPTHATKLVGLNKLRGSKEYFITQSVNLMADAKNYFEAGLKK